MAGLTLRPGIDADLPRVRTFIAGVQARLGIQHDPGTADADLVAPGFYAPPRGRLEVLEHAQDGIVGLIGTIELDANEAELKKLYVASALRGTGCGAFLLERSIAWARERGCRRMVLETNSALERAMLLYTRRGFVVSTDTAPRGQDCDRRLELAL